MSLLITLPNSVPGTSCFSAHPLLSILEVQPRWFDCSQLHLPRRINLYCHHAVLMQRYPSVPLTFSSSNGPANSIFSGAALAECLQNSDCIMVYRNKPGDCLRPPLNATLPTRCQQPQKEYSES